jgi:hypothetical protein
VTLIFSPLSISQTRNGTTSWGEKVIQIGDVAPYGGVLVPNERYLHYKEELEICHIERQKPDDCRQFDFSDGFMFFLGGVMAGFILGAASNP